MCILIGFLILTAGLFGFGAALHALWWVAVAFLVNLAARLSLPATPRTLVLLVAR